MSGRRQGWMVVGALSVGYWIATGALALAAAALAFLLLLAIGLLLADERWPRPDDRDALSGIGKR